MITKPFNFINYHYYLHNKKKNERTQIGIQGTAKPIFYL